jgi:hypothetical protein
MDGARDVHLQRRRRQTWPRHVFRGAAGKREGWLGISGHGEEERDRETGQRESAASAMGSRRQDELQLVFSSSQRRNKVGLRAGVPERGEGLEECECERCKSGE